jgi:asparagine synthase (glutamine-hydrolysing)
MCGVAGIWAVDGATAEHADLVLRMLRTLGRRGPDGYAVRVEGRAVLGHARLAIIDLATGDQPLGNEDGSIQAILNGEIYNYRELREELLAAGSRLSTTSDTETIPHLYARMGEGFLERLRGMFVVVVHDVPRGRLLIARDRVGKKPLYYARLPWGVAYASEPRALLEIPEVDRTPDLEAIGHLLTWQYVPAPWSIYRGVRKLEAATLLTLDADGGATSRPYWSDVPTPTTRLSSDEALERVEATLERACELRLRADVPIGAFLSGGIDSGLVTALSAKRLEGTLTAVHVAFGGPDDETALARATAKASGARLVERVLNVDAAAACLEVLDYMDEPHGDSSCVPTWLVCRAARETATVAISGDGGDETFAGYPALYGQNMALERLRRAFPRAAREALFGGLSAIWPGDVRLPRPLRLKNALAAAARSLTEAYLVDRSVYRPAAWRAALKPAIRERLTNFDPYAGVRALAETVPPEASALDRLLFFDRRTYLAEGVIAKVDRMSMAHSLEVRSPLLDQDMVELSLRVADDDKFRGGVGKRVLRRLADKLLPPEVARAKKSGFAPPLAGWLRGPLKPIVEERLFRSPTLVGALFEPEALRALYERHLSGARNHARELWTLLALESWARNFAPDAARTMPA